MVIDKKRGDVFSEIWMDGEPVTSAEKKACLTLVGSGGKSYATLDPPEQIKVMEKGAMRGAVLVKGKHRSDDGETLFTYEFEFHFYAGWSGIKVYHVWENDSTSEDFAAIKSLSLQIPALTGESMAVGGESGDYFVHLPAQAGQLPRYEYSRSYRHARQSRLPACVAREQCEQDQRPERSTETGPCESDYGQNGTVANQSYY